MKTRLTTNRRQFFKQAAFIAGMFALPAFDTASAEPVPTVDASASARWSSEKANEWYQKHPFILGCNFLPSTAINDIEMWQAETFDPETIDRELGWAKQWKINSVRVFLNYVVWEADAEGLKKRFETFLQIAAKHGISVMPVLFDDCNFSRGIAKIGKQPDPIPGITMSAWVSSPPANIQNNPKFLPKFKAYVQGMIRAFKNDSRVLVWDIYNEPCGNGENRRFIGNKKHNLLEFTFQWAREVCPDQPLTVCVWDKFDAPLAKRTIQLSDVITFHSYDTEKGIDKKIKILEAYKRPVICTEWLMRQSGCTPEIILPLLKKKNIGSYHWGLVNGKTQTHYQWGSSAKKPLFTPWMHDLMHKDGTPYKAEELQLFKNL